MSLIFNTNSKNIFIKNEKIKTLYFNLIIVFLGSILLALSSQFKVPLGPVPVTLQSMVVMLIGICFGLRLSIAIILAYWFEGIILGGFFSFMPWFANGSGLVYFLSSPSAGFLWGFLPMIAFIGFSLKLLPTNLIRNKPFIGLFLIFSILIFSQIILYCFGVFHAYFFILPAVDWMNSFSELKNIYITPFLIGDLIKTLLATLISFKVYNFFRKKIKP